MKKVPSFLLFIAALLTSCQSSATDTLTPRVEEMGNYRNWYEIFVYSFADSDGDGIGDLNGIDSKLSYLADIGYTGIWLTPIFASPSYHKYDTTDYFTIDEDFGTMDDLKKLVEDAHNLGMKVILDGVFNHTAYYHPWFLSALEAHKKLLAGETLTEEESLYESLYVFADDDTEKETGHTYYRAGANSFYYEGNFSSGMPELNFDSDYTYEKIQSVIDYYMGDEQGIGIDGFRLDAVKYYKLNDTSANVQILSKIEKMVLDNDSEGYCVGECWSNSSDIAQYYQSDLDSFFWFPGGTGTGTLSYCTNYEGMGKNYYLSGLEEMVDAAGEHIPAPFLDNHDTPRMSLAKDENTTKFLLGLRDMENGAVFNYYGDEIGMSSANGSGGDYADSNYRTHYYWDDETHEMECKDNQYASEQTEYYPAAKTQLEDETSILNYEKKALTIRNHYPAIARGEISVTTSDEELNAKSRKESALSAFDRTYNGETVKTVINFSAYDSFTYTVDGYTPEAYLLVDENEATYESNTLTLPPRGIAILTKD